ncbi:MAG: oxygenase MpaB family protein [Acidimicrobiales bacterium]
MRSSGTLGAVDSTHDTQRVIHPDVGQAIVARVARGLAIAARMATLDALGRATRPHLVAHQLRAAPIDPDDPPWCPPGSASWTIHGDQSSLIGGVLALWLQALHPLALAGVLDHSDFEDDPLGRFHRTEAFVVGTTYAPGSRARELCRHVRDEVHPRIVGTAADGRPYAAGDPRLLDWIHCALVLAVARCWLAYGDRPDSALLDSYVAEQARVPVELGDPDPPRSWAQLLARIDGFQGELVVDERTAWLDEWLANPPLPGRARLVLPLYRVVHRAGLAAAPSWALRLWGRRRPGPPARIAGTALTATIRGFIAAGPPRSPSSQPYRRPAA